MNGDAQKGTCPAKHCHLLLRERDGGTGRRAQEAGPTPAFPFASRCDGLLAVLGGSQCLPLKCVLFCREACTQAKAVVTSLTRKSVFLCVDWQLGALSQHTCKPPASSLAQCGCSPVVIPKSKRLQVPIAPHGSYGCAAD